MSVATSSHLKSTESPLFVAIPSVSEDLAEPIFGGLVIAGSDCLEARESVAEDTVISQVEGRAAQSQEV